MNNGWKKGVALAAAMVVCAFRLSAFELPGYSQVAAIPESGRFEDADIVKTQNDGYYISLIADGRLLVYHADQEWGNLTPLTVSLPDSGARFVNTCAMMNVANPSFVCFTKAPADAAYGRLCIVAKGADGSFACDEATIAGRPVGPVAECVFLDSNPAFTAIVVRKEKSVSLVKITAKDSRAEVTETVLFSESLYAQLTNTTRNAFPGYATLGMECRSMIPDTVVSIYLENGNLSADKTAVKIPAATMAIANGEVSGICDFRPYDAVSDPGKMLSRLEVMQVGPTKLVFDFRSKYLNVYAKNEKWDLLYSLAGSWRYALPDAYPVESLLLIDDAGRSRAVDFKTGASLAGKEPDGMLPGYAGARCIVSGILMDSEYKTTGFSYTLPVVADSLAKIISYDGEKWKVEDFSRRLTFPKTGELCYTNGFDCLLRFVDENNHDSFVSVQTGTFFQIPDSSRSFKTVKVVYVLESGKQLESMYSNFDSKEALSLCMNDTGSFHLKQIGLIGESVVFGAGDSDGKKSIVIYAKGY